MPTNIAVLVGALVLASIGGYTWRRSNGHFRGAATAPSAGRTATDTAAGSDPPAAVLTSDDLSAELGERATLLQFSSAFCAPCRATRRVLSDVAQLVPGVTHVEIDAEHHLDLVRRLGVMRTPTTFVLDASGAVVTRASGAPTKPQVIAALGRADAGDINK